MIKKFLWATLANFAVGPDAGLPSKVAPITTDRENGFRRDGSADAGKLNYMFGEIGDKLQSVARGALRSGISSFALNGAVHGLEYLRDMRSFAGFISSAGNLRTVLANAHMSGHTNGATGGAVAYATYPFSTYVNHTGPLGGVKGALFTYSGASHVVQSLDNETALTTAASSFVPVAATSYKDIAFDGVQNVYIVEGGSFIRGNSSGVWSQFAASGDVAAGRYVDGFLGPSASEGKVIIFAQDTIDKVGYIEGSSFTEFTLTVNGGAGSPSTWGARWFSRPVWDSENSRWIVQAGDLAQIAIGGIRWYAVTAEDEITPISDPCSYVAGQGVAEVAPGCLAALVAHATGSGPLLVPEIVLSFDGGATWEHTGIRFSSKVASAADFRDAGILKTDGTVLGATVSGSFEYLSAGPFGTLGAIV